MRDDLEWMRVALEEADAASAEGEVPVGCVIVSPDGEEIARGRNARESLQDPTAHAEMLRDSDRFVQACKLEIGRRNGLRNPRTVRDVRGRPCSRAGRACRLRLRRSQGRGCLDALRDRPRRSAQPSLRRYAGLLETECAERLRAFFSALRALGKK